MNESELKEELRLFKYELLKEIQDTKDLAREAIAIAQSNYDAEYDIDNLTDRVQKLEGKIK